MEKEIVNKLLNFCAYQERCKQEVTQKILKLDAEEDLEDLLDYLEEENFLDEARFARQFAGGKFRVKKWGRYKIKANLRRKGISSDLIARAFLSEISEEDYQQTILKWIESKEKDYGDLSDYKNRAKLKNFLFLKGFEHDCILEAIKDFGISDY